MRRRKEVRWSKKGEDTLRLCGLAEVALRVAHSKKEVLGRKAAYAFMAIVSGSHSQTRFSK